MITREQFEKNLSYLQLTDVKFCGQAWDDKEFSAELECYTPAGEDMIVCLEELSRECLMDFISNFDINERVVMWWPNGRKVEGKGVPFDNIKEHYEDYEAWLENLSEIADGLV